MGPRELMALAIILAACTVQVPQGSDTTTTVQITATAPPLPEEQVLPDVSELVKEVEDGVVAIFQTRQGFDAFLQPVEVPAGAGTGIVIDDQGHVLTNSHVIAGASSVFVTSVDGQEREAAVVGDRPERDLALLRVEDAGGMVPLPLGDSESLEVGDPVVAIGNALNLGDQPTVSVGIVSALDRAIEVAQGQILEDLIQTDAAINPGNSGGPLLNRGGEVVGINTAVAGGVAQNIGFAISIDGVRPLIEDFLSGAGQPFMGVGLLDNSPRLAQAAGLSVDTGAVVASVSAGSAAAEASLQRGDVVVGVNGRPVATRDDLISVIESSEPGDTLELEVVRGDQRDVIAVTIGQR